MAKQLVFTSVLRGLDPGRSGYCTVARHRDLRERLVPEIERLSAYHHVNYTYGDGVLNPVVMAFRTITLGETRYHIFTRIVDAGFDYSRRSNYLAHHLIVEEKEITGGITPADIFLGWNGWLDKWEGEPRFYGPADDVSLADMLGATQPALPAQNWAALAGDAGAAAAPLDAAPRQGFAFAVRPGSERVLLSLYRESTALLPVHERWKLGFTTYLQETDRANDFRWAGHWLDHQPISASGWTVLDLRQAGLVPAPAGLAAERARVGDKPKLVPPPATTLTPPKAEPAAKKWDLAKPPGASAAPRPRAVILSQEDVPARSRWKWPVMAASVLVVLCLLGGAGYRLMKTDDASESRESPKKDPFAGKPVEEKAAAFAAAESARSPSPPVPASVVLPPTETVLRQFPLVEPVGMFISSTPIESLEAPRIKTYIAWREKGVKLMPKILGADVEKNGSIKILKEGGVWIDALAMMDSHVLKIGPAEDVDSYNIQIKNGEVEIIPNTLEAIRIGTNCLVFVKKENQAPSMWPNSTEVLIDLRRNEVGRLDGMSGLVFADSGRVPEMEYLLPLTKDLTDAISKLRQANGVGVSSGLSAALSVSVNQRGDFILYSKPDAPDVLEDKNRVGVALEKYRDDWSKLNQADVLDKLERRKKDKFNAIGEAIGLPSMKGDESLLEVSKIDLIKNNTAAKLAKNIFDVMLGQEYKFIEFSSDEKSFTVENVLIKAESLYKADSKNLAAKAVVDKFITVTPRGSKIEDKKTASLVWINTVRETLVEYANSLKEYDKARRDTATYGEIKRHFESFYEFWNDAMNGRTEGANVYIIMDDSDVSEKPNRINLGQIKKGSAQ
jgi:GTPase-associated protein 1, N-terminal domain type 2